MPIAPHGGELISRLASPEEGEALLARAASLPRVTIDGRTTSDLEMIGTGALSPLTGFMSAADYRAVIADMHLANGLPWTIPITLGVEPEAADALSLGAEIALANAGGDVLAVMTVEEKYTYDKPERCRAVFKTDDEAHPGVAATLNMCDVLLGGPVTLPRPIPHRRFLEHRLPPAETRALFAEKGWNTVVGFQTRNPIHRAHEYLQKCAMEIVDGLMIHPIVGETKSDDISAEVRMQCYTALMEGYYPADRVCLVVNPAAMRYAGPREAIFHALIRKNYGCTHFIVGRDHAGVGNYYGTYDAQYIFKEFDPAKLEITPLFFEHAFWCTKCGNMASTKTCPHGKDDHVFFSGTKVREMLREGELPPPEFTRPEIANLLLEAAKGAA
ncbi:MAG: sulfate adenylyltransferase [Candidatus Coatesbacteria bacterium]|nr:MAG: sulfate adenylyltransferase [Candidatus Coatesbacteria bacterium]